MMSIADEMKCMVLVNNYCECTKVPDCLKPYM